MGVAPRLYIELALMLRRRGDLRQPDEIVTVAINDWLIAYTRGDEHHGYQWKSCFRPTAPNCACAFKAVGTGRVISPSTNSANTAPPHRVGISVGVSGKADNPSFPRRREPIARVSNVGALSSQHHSCVLWVPAFAGMTSVQGV